MTIVLAGGSGFLGRALASRLRQDRHDVLTLTRHPRANGTDIAWNPDDGAGPWTETVASADVIVNLAGESIADKRWTDRRKRLLSTSRIIPTRSLVSAINTAPQPPRLLIAGSAIGFYAAQDDEPVTERTAPGDDFLARLCVDWEREAARAASDRCRVAVIRTGIVLHPKGGALAQMLTPFRFGVGGPMGSGRQFMSWIHRDDWVALVIHMIAAHKRDVGVSKGHAVSAAMATGHADEAVTAYNATAPVPVTNRDFARTLGRVLKRPAVVRIPAFALQLALGEMAQAALLTGARVLPARAEAEGFRFTYPELEPALRNLLDRA
jgi:uncharacterized protein (TIGR01777 family)